MVGAILVGVYASESSHIERNAARLHGQAVELTAHIGRIMQLDEVLTMSARMAAASRDPSYETRYRQFEPELDRIIKETTELFPLPEALRDTQETDKANQRLVEMEHRSFDLDHAGQFAAALDLLTSPEYLQQKARYSQGMRATFAALQVALGLHEQRIQRAGHRWQATGLLGIVVILLGWILSIQAVVAQRRAEEQLRQARDRLEMQVQERTAELAAANQLLTDELRARKRIEGQLIQSEKMSAVGQLASGIAHEVKNPLQIIVQGIDYLAGEVGQERQELAEAIRMIKAAIGRADRIVQELLRFSRPAPLQLAPSALSEAVHAAALLVDKQLRVKNVEVVNEMPDDLPFVLLDRNQIQQVFINLMLNAFQAMPGGGVLTIRGFVKTLSALDPGVGQRASDRFTAGQAVVVCELQDTGSGIAPEALSKVFDPFFTTKPVGAGTGLGLSMTRTIIENHGGMIGIDSAPGQGTTIRLIFPEAAGGSHA